MKKGDILELKCKKCGTVGDNRFVKSWRMEGKGSVETEIQQFKCSSCRRKWRRGVVLNKGRS